MELRPASRARRLLRLSPFVAGGAAATFALGRRRRDRFPDRSRVPELEPDALETVAVLPRPPGNVAVSAEGRVFFTFHPDLRPPVNVVELVDGRPVPYPGEALQSRQNGRPFFDTVLSLRIDRQGRLWTLDHGRHGLRQPRLLAFDLSTGRQVHWFDFDRSHAPRGSNLNDFQVDPTGRWIYIADASILRRRPAILVYDMETGACRRLLENHPAVVGEPFTPRVQGRTMRLFGVVPLRTGVDSIALDDAGRHLYFAPVTSRFLYRIDTDVLKDPASDDGAGPLPIESFAPKPMTDGITLDSEGNVYLSAIEHSAIMRLSPGGELTALVESDRLRWPDGFGFGPDGWLYVTCSALHEVILRGSAGIRRRAPYHLFRMQTGAAAIPGH